VVYLGDNLLKGGIMKFVNTFNENEKMDALILLTKVKDPQRFGVAEFDERGKLAHLVEKPKVPPSNYALAGIYFFSQFIIIAKIVGNNLDKRFLDASPM
jgi:glucose-1-phosphate thymidylyltransferase